MSLAQIDASKTARDLAQKNVEAEQQKYELGGVTAFEVLDAQSRLASVEGSLLRGVCRLPPRPSSPYEARRVDPV